METIRVDRRELATIIAALHFYGRRDAPCPEEEIATHGGALHPLSVSEIEALLNGPRFEFPPDDEFKKWRAERAGPNSLEALIAIRDYLGWKTKEDARTAGEAVTRAATRSVADAIGVSAADENGEEDEDPWRKTPNERDAARIAFLVFEAIELAQMGFNDSSLIVSWLGDGVLDRRSSFLWLPDERTRATTLAALRFWQRQFWYTKPEYRIASDGGAIRPLGSVEIDDLVKRLTL